MVILQELKQHAFKQLLAVIQDFSAMAQPLVQMLNAFLILSTVLQISSVTVKQQAQALDVLQIQHIVQMDIFQMESCPEQELLV